MAKDRIITTSAREIKHSFKRFLSLLVMSMLGVGVFVGLKMSSPDMLKSVDKYYDDNNLYDIKLVSTLGLTGDDVSSLKQLDSISNVYNSYSKDVLIQTKTQESVIKVMGITNDVNKIKIIKGRKPNNNKEIVVEEHLLEIEKLKIGDTIELLDNDSFKETSLTIVGTVKSPLYISSTTGNASRGSTNLGNGKISYYTYVLDSNFNINYYTELYITVKGAKKETTNSNNYNNLIDNALKQINTIKSTRQKARYEEIYNAANKELTEKENEGLDVLNTSKKELDNAGNTLSNAKGTLLSTKNVLDTSKELLDNNKLTLDNTKLQIDRDYEALNNTLSSYNLSLDDIVNGINQIYNTSIPKDTIINAIPAGTYHDEMVNAVDTIYALGLEDKLKNFISDPANNEDDLINVIPNTIPNYGDVIQLINVIGSPNTIETLQNYVKDQDNINKIINKIPTGTTGYNEIVSLINSLSDPDLINNIENYLTDPNNIDIIINAIPNTPENAGLISALNQYKIDSATYLSIIEDAIKLAITSKEYSDGLSYYNLAFKQYQLGYDDYASGLREYNNNYNLYTTKVAEYYDSLNMFNTEISNAKDNLSSIPKATWYDYDRLDDSGYSSFVDDGESVTNLAKVFPTIFFVVAILISLISMSRMVEDDRMLIGTLKSLGFNNKAIRKKYLLYSASATILGGLIGSTLGFFLLPKIIFNIYHILFVIPDFVYDYNLNNIILGISIAVICICGTTLVTISKVVKERPSELMRPKAPAKGKRVLLERIPFIWKHINFSNKITARNIFRYKKRVIMTVGGILGCTALMLAGFGIRDSIVEIPNKQYNHVYDYDEMVYLTNSLSKEDLDNTFSNKHIVSRLDSKMIVSMSSNNIDINIFVPYDSNNMNGILNLYDLKTSKKLTLEDNSVIISDKLAQLANKKVGDMITITSSDNKEYSFVINGICENYVGNFVFMNKDTYENNIDVYETNIVYLKIDDVKNEDTLIKHLLKDENIMSVSSINATIDSVNNMLKSLNSVVLILIILSGALSFVVLYNLSYINISERKREIATLKVLGFTDKEVDNYITKETVILTILGIGIGLILGIFLTNIIVDTVEISMVRFLRQITPLSFIITSLLMISFTFVVNFIIHFSLKKIDMIESLKSVE